LRFRALVGAHRLESLAHGCTVIDQFPKSRRGASALLLAVLLGAAACSDDIPVIPPQDTETGGTSSSGTDTNPPVGSSTAVVDSTDTASGTGDSGASSSGADSTGSSSTGETEGTTGEPVIAGRTVSQLVNAGTRTSSRNYTLVHTLGQPSPLQSTHASPSYRLQGGLVGANGSPP
jgi:hypothetical protein